MITATSRAALDAALAGARAAGRSVGFVPTMGALHEGHLSLVKRARAGNDVTVASVFVNPLQFGPKEDFAAYPRDLSRDAGLLEGAGCDVLYAPDGADMYPAGFETRVVPGPVAEPLCGASRPGHFTGVCTVVLKLFQRVRPQRAYFGQKDAQQVRVIQRMAEDLDLPVEIVMCPTGRAADGLALSSRNAYLGADDRLRAPRLYAALQAGERAFTEENVDDPAEIGARMRAELAREPAFAPEYLEAVSWTTLRPETPLRRPVLLAGAARLGNTRLIDNILIGDLPCT